MKFRFSLLWEFNSPYYENSILLSTIFQLSLPGNFMEIYFSVEFSPIWINPYFHETYFIILCKNGP
jgi:hypothetical protein